jgi:GPH family glycoside/pentoside/hexuronide:cation symporter
MPALSRWKKISYGLGGLSMVLPDSVFVQWIFVRYASDPENALVSPALFGALFMAARAIAAIAEVAIGHFSDHFVSPRGRRMPFIRVGLLPFALAFFFMWTPPVSHAHWLNAVYIFCMMQTYLLLFPTVLTPYIALIPEMTQDPKERVTLTTLQALSIMIGTILFALIGLLINARGWIFTMTLVSFSMFFALLPFALTHKESPSTSEGKSEEPLLKAIWSALHNRPFLYLVFSTSLFLFSLNSMQMTLPFWVKTFLHEDESKVTLLMAPLLVVTMTSFTVIPALVSKIGKYPMFLVSIAGMAACMLLFLGIGQFPLGSPLLQTGIVLAIIGLPMAGLAALPLALIADVIDFDEKRTGRRREALFIALQGTIQKMFAASVAVVFARLAFQGASGEVTVYGLRCVVFSTVVVCVAAMAIFWMYPLRERKA